MAKREPKLSVRSARPLVLAFADDKGERFLLTFFEPAIFGQFSMIKSVNVIQHLLLRGLSYEVVCNWADVVFEIKVKAGRRGMHLDFMRH